MRLIDADAIKYTPRFVSYGKRCTNDGVVTSTEIDAMPSIDPVKHGTWILFDGRYYCSECDDDMDWKTYYCPNCGAKMDLEEKDDDT